MLYTRKTFDYEHEVKEADVVLIGVPFSSTETGHSVKDGPLFIREAIKNVIGYDTELNLNIFEKLKFSDLGDIDIVPGNWKLTNERIKDTVESLFSENKNIFPVFLGGEHLITMGILESMSKILSKKITVIDFDAHRDLMPDWLGEKYSHITWARHIVDNFELIQIGCRTLNKEEEPLLKKVKDKIEKTDNPVYITIDLDVLDPSINPEVGTPEPMGMKMEELLKHIKNACQNNVIGMDIVECASRKVDTQTALNAAFLFKKTLGYICQKK